MHNCILNFQFSMLNCETPDGVSGFARGYVFYWYVCPTGNLPQKNTLQIQSHGRFRPRRSVRRQSHGQISTRRGVLPQSHGQIRPRRGVRRQSHGQIRPRRGVRPQSHGQIRSRRGVRLKMGRRKRPKCPTSHYFWIASLRSQWLDTQISPQTIIIHN